MFDPPIFINVRDRVRDLRKLVAWLEDAGHERIILLDNASTWPPLLEYLEQTPHTVSRGRNLGSRSIWAWEKVPDEPFVFTDPDLIPIEECPKDAVMWLYELLCRYPNFPKVGLGLYLDDVPLSMGSLGWEQSLVTDDRLLEPSVYNSLVDTTFALHRPGFGHTLDAIRTGFPYQARHTSWYVTEPDEEDAYYLAHAVRGPLGSSWAQVAA